MEKPKIRPPDSSLEHTSTWDDILRQWRDQQAILDLSQLGTPERPIPHGFLAGLRDDNGIVGDLDCTSACLARFDW